MCFYHAAGSDNHPDAERGAIPFLWILPLGALPADLPSLLRRPALVQARHVHAAAAVALGGMTYAMSDDFQNLGLEALDSIVHGWAILLLDGLTRRTGAIEACAAAPPLPFT